MKNEKQYLKSISLVALARYPSADEFVVKKFVNHGEMLLLINPVVLDQPTMGEVVSRAKVEEWSKWQD